MPAEGMVDALEEAHRVLVDGGTLIDVRPDHRPYDSPTKDRFSFLDGHMRQLGHYVHSPGFFDLCRSSDAAVRDVVERGLFSLQAEDGFTMRTYFRSLEAIAAKHERGLEVLEPSARRRTERLFVRHPGGRIMLEEDALVNVLRRLTTKTAPAPASASGPYA